MYKKILCAVDVSEEGEAVIAKAIELAKQYDSDLSIIHVIEYSLLPKDYQKRMHQEVIPKVDLFGEQFNIDRKHRYIKFGQSYVEVCALERELNADLIVVGSHGKHGIKALLGATANGILQQAKCDVLLVKMDNSQ